jgi:hypothetical protein
VGKADGNNDIGKGLKRQRERKNVGVGIGFPGKSGWIHRST